MSAVVLFHAGVGAVSGGYLGVDVFFVISGYLITQVLSGNAALPPAEQLRIFYLRRARRILPALVALLPVAALAAWLLFSPRALQVFGRYLSLGAAFLGNVPAWQDQVDYFALDQNNLPLLHLWSLGVEEQFYLFYPLLFIGLAGLTRAWRTRWLALMFLGSLLSCAWASHAHPHANFFTPVTRAWELLLGALLALTTAGPSSAGSRAASRLTPWLAGGALLVLLASIVLFPTDVPHPGLGTLLPCGATAVLIATGRHANQPVAKLLAWRPLVALGLISYSLYLWHLPLLSFAGNYNIRPLDGVQRALLLLALCAVAALSWRFVEQPIRQRRWLHGDRGFVAACGVSLGALCVGGLLLANSDGLPARFPPDVRLAFAGTQRFPSDSERCMGLAPRDIGRGAWCAFGSPRTDAPVVMLWGDSHALSLLPALEVLVSAHDMRLYFAGQGSCRPLSGVSRGAARSAYAEAACADYNAAMAEAARRLRPRLLILAARWTYPPSRLVLEPGVEQGTGESAFLAGLRASLRRAQRAAGSSCVVLDVPALDYPGAQALAMARLRGIDSGFLRPRRDAVLEYQAREQSDLELLRARGAIVTADPKQLLCRDALCLVESGGRPLYADAGHLTVDGALFVAPALADCFRGPVTAPGARASP